VPSDPDEPTWLDAEHMIEPLDSADLEPLANDPIVVDAKGRIWRVRYRPAWTGVSTWAAPVLLAMVLVALLLVLRV